MFCTFYFAVFAPNPPKGGLIPVFRLSQILNLLDSTSFDPPLGGQGANLLHIKYLI
jgi:hypothetical protein